MRYFIFLTQEGYTFQPNSESTTPDIENLQVLGTASGTDDQNAFDNLIKENEFLLDTDYKDVMAMELKNEKSYYFSLKE